MVVSNKMDTPSIVVVGIGNTIRKDDAIGIIVGEKVAEKIGAEFVEETSVDLTLYDLLESHDKMIIIDSIVTGNFPPGTVHEFSTSDIGRPERDRGAHRRNLPAIIQIAKEQGIPVEEKLAIFGIEVLKVDEFGEGLSPKIEKKVDSIANKISLIIGSG